MEEQKTWVDVPKMYTLTKVGYLHNSSKVEFVFMLDCGFSRNTPYMQEPRHNPLQDLYIHYTICVRRYIPYYVQDM